MSACPECGGSVGSGVRFCNDCGAALAGRSATSDTAAEVESAGGTGWAPAPDRWQQPSANGALSTRDGRGPWMVAAAAATVVVVLLLAGGGAYAYSRTQSDEPVPPPSPPATATDTPTQQPTYEPPVEADNALRATASTDRGSVEALTGYWVPQLSSKRAGMVIDGVTWDDDMILAHARTLAGQYPEVLLLNSSDYSSFRTGGLWVLVIGTGYASSDAANAWCDRQGIGADDCFAKRIVQDGPDGNTAPR